MKKVKTELLKQRKIIFILCIIFPLLINGLLYVDLQYRYTSYLLVHQSEYGLSNWQLIFKEQTIFYFSELCHIVAATVVYEIFSVELKSNGWLLVASSPYGKKGVIAGKYSIAMLAVILFLLVNYISLFLIGKSMIGTGSKVEITLLVKAFFIQLPSMSFMVSFSILITCLWKKISLLIPIGCVFTVLNVAFYYTDDVKFRMLYPFTYISHCFRAAANECIITGAVSVIATILLLGLSRYVLQKNLDLQV